MSVTFVGSVGMADVFPNVNEFVHLVTNLFTAYGSFKASFTGLLGTLDAVLDALVTIEGGLDFVLNASFGLIPLKLNATLEFQGALKAMGGLSLAISNPLAQAVAAITAMGQAIASLQASLSLGLPTVSADLSMQLSVVAAVAAAAAAKMAGIQAVIDAVGSLLGPLVNAKLLIDNLKADLQALLAPLDLSFDGLTAPLADFTAHLAGGVGGGAYLYSMSSMVDNLGAELAAEFAVLPPGIPSGHTVRGVLVLVDFTAKPALWGDVSFLMRTSP